MEYVKQLTKLFIH